MPTYEYRCEKCGHVFETFHKISKEPLKDCPKCHKPALKRGVGGQNAVLQFKGSGFYITDYSKENKASKKEKNKNEKKDN